MEKAVVEGGESRAAAKEGEDAPEVEVRADDANDVDGEGAKWRRKGRANKKAGEKGVEGVHTLEEEASKKNKSLDINVGQRKVQSSFSHPSEFVTQYPDLHVPNPIPKKGSQLLSSEKRGKLTQKGVRKKRLKRSFESLFAHSARAVEEKTDSKKIKSPRTIFFVFRFFELRRRFFFSVGVE